MRNLWFISDPHFWHANVLKFLDKHGNRMRPFSSLEEMHETIIENHNRLVKPQDKVYWLGDITFQYHAGFSAIMSRLNGHKRLIVGNHDKIWNPALIKWFDKAMLWRGWKEHNFTASHIPLRLDSLRDGNYNVHGHVHCNSLQDPHYLNVCVEVRNYTPVHVDQLKAEQP